jgi:Mn-containing catalase
MDIGTEELSHLEVVGTLARLHLAPMKFGRGAAEADPLIAIAGGGGVNLFNSMGNAWTADYLKITGELDVDLRSNIAAEARAKIVYERLIQFCDDVGTKDALQFLMSREITHMKAFAAALDSLEKPRFAVGQIAPTAGLVNQYFNASTGEGDRGEIDARGPWNEGGEWELVESAVVNGHGGNGKDAEVDMQTEASEADDPDTVRELLLENVRDLLHAEKQLVKAIPKMSKAAKTEQLRLLFTQHLQETEEQVNRLTECLKLLGAPARAKPCKGMMGLLEEGDEIIAEHQKKPAGMDLALIAAGQKVEHYEIACYKSARDLAQQLNETAIVHLLQLSLSEEENADQLLNQLARPLMSSAKMPEAVI